MQLLIVLFLFQRAMTGHRLVDFFFFQAEDGIRDRSPSRGLGDVYKRQVVGSSPTRGVFLMKE